MGVRRVLEHLREILVLDQLADIIHVIEYIAYILLLSLIRRMLELSDTIAAKGDDG